MDREKLQEAIEAELAPLRKRVAAMFNQNLPKKEQQMEQLKKLQEEVDAINARLERVIAHLDPAGAHGFARGGEKAFTTEGTEPLTYQQASHEVGKRVEKLLFDRPKLDYRSARDRVLGADENLARIYANGPVEKAA